MSGRKKGKFAYFFPQKEKKFVKKFKKYHILKITIFGLICMKIPFFRAASAALIEISNADLRSRQEEFLHFLQQKIKKAFKICATLSQK